MSERPAETVKRAAALMRQRAEAASPGPWKSRIEGRDHHGGDSFIQTGCDYDLSLYLATTGYGKEGIAEWEASHDHVASWHPLVALAVAGWLESLNGIDWSEHHSYSDELMHALKVARAYLGDESP